MTPFYRAAAAAALGRIDSQRAVAALTEAITDYDNAVSVRNAAADALLNLSEYVDAGRLDAIAQTYPEISTKRILQQIHHPADLYRASP